MTRPRARGHTALADEQGGVALLVVMAMFVLGTAGLVVLGAVSDLAVTAARARAAADAAALAAVGATPLLGGDGGACAAASAAADANNARLVRCQSPDGSGVGAIVRSGVLVEIAVTPDRRLVRAVAGEIHARAAADLRPSSAPPLPPPDDAPPSAGASQRSGAAPD